MTEVAKFLRHICTVYHPYDPAKHGTHAQHPSARRVGGDDSGACDDFHRPICGTEWRTCYDDD